MESIAWNWRLRVYGKALANRNPDEFVANFFQADFSRGAMGLITLPLFRQPVQTSIRPIVVRTF